MSWDKFDYDPSYYPPPPPPPEPEPEFKKAYFTVEWEGYVGGKCRYLGEVDPLAKDTGNHLDSRICRLLDLAELPKDVLYAPVHRKLCSGFLQGKCPFKEMKNER